LAANGTIYERRSEEEGMQEVYSVGDRVVYPMHGAGLIEAIEEREILGEKDHYYIMRLQMGDMKVMVPRGSAEEVGLRPIIDSDQVPKVYEVLKAEATPMSQNWNRRYRANMEKMKTGDIFVVAEVVRNLGIRDREKGLSTGERRMLDNAKQILASELAMVEGRSLEEVTSGIEEILS
jgi:CarD family transcriptional regulator